jgi:7-cyano-7-deazaguanine synthase in queuosine biosynthesis
MRLNDSDIKNKIRHLLNLAIINLDSCSSAGNDSSMLLWRAYVNIEYAILILKLTYNNNNSKNEIQPQSMANNRNPKDAIVTKSMMNSQDKNDLIKRLKFILQHLNFQDKKLLLRQLRLHRNLIKNWLQKKEYQ